MKKKKEKKQKPPAAAAEEKKVTENRSGGVNGYLLLGIGGLAVSALGVYINQLRGDYGEPWLPAKLGPLSRSQSQSQAAISA